MSESPATRSTRASVSFPPALYDELVRIAAQKKVSVAWVIRDAVERYVGERYPLLDGLPLAGARE